MMPKAASSTSSSTAQATRRASASVSTSTSVVDGGAASTISTAPLAEIPPAVRKAQIQAVVDFVRRNQLQFSNGKPVFLNNVQEYFAVPRHTFYRTIRQRDPNEEDEEEQADGRGRPSKLNIRDVYRTEEFLAQHNFDTRSFNWEKLVEAMNLACGHATLRREMITKDFRRCPSCRQGWVAQHVADARVSFARDLMRRFPTIEHWRQIRWSTELHFGCGSKGRILTMTKPGTRHCEACAEAKRNDPKAALEEQEQRRAEKQARHAWVAIGRNFKTRLVFYTYQHHPARPLGSFTPQTYTDQVLNVHVKSWIDRGDSFVLAEERENGHGTGRTSVAAKWKKEHHIDPVWIPNGSPDLAVIDNSWDTASEFSLQCPQWEAEVSEWDDNLAHNVIQTAWDTVSMETINAFIDDLPRRVQRIIESNGQLTGY